VWQHSHVYVLHYVTVHCAVSCNVCTDEPALALRRPGHAESAWDRVLVQIDPRSSLAYYLKAALILTTLAAAYYGTFFLFQSFVVRCRGAATWHRFIFSAPLLSMISSPSLRAHAPESSKCPCGTIALSFPQRM